MTEDSARMIFEKLEGVTRSVYELKVGTLQAVSDLKTEINKSISDLKVNMEKRPCDVHANKFEQMERSLKRVWTFVTLIIGTLIGGMIWGAFK